MREGAVADPRDAGIRPHRFVGRARERDDVQRQRYVAHYPLDLLGIGEARDEEAARAGIGERLAAFDDLIDQRVVICLVFRNRSVRALM